MLKIDLSLANFKKNVLDHKNAPNVCLLMNWGLIDPMQVFVFTVDLGNPKKRT